MTDRELLEMAAKAAGYQVVGNAHQVIAQGVSYHALVIRNERGGDSVFDPLTDDGDALRLAVKLGLTVCNEHESAGVVYCTRAYTEEFPAITSGKVGDPVGVTTEDYAATRRAIVRAAAEIGASL